MQDETLIVEDVMLLLLDDSSGAIAGAGTLHYVLGGAVLVDLALRGRVEIDEQEKGWRSALNGPLVRALDGDPISDPVLREALETVDEKPQRVMPLLIGIGANLREPVIDRLVERGLIRRESGRFLRLFPTTRLPVADGRHESVMRRRVADLLEGGPVQDARTAAIAALVSASGVHRRGRDEHDDLRSGVSAQREGNQSAISRAEDSSESEACTRFSRFESDRSPRIVPGSATRPSVLPLSRRTTAIASSPSSTSETSGPDTANSRSGGYQGCSTCSA